MTEISSKINVRSSVKYYTWHISNSHDSMRSALDGYQRIESSSAGTHAQRTNKTHFQAW